VPGWVPATRYTYISINDTKFIALGEILVIIRVVINLSVIGGLADTDLNLTRGPWVTLAHMKKLFRILIYISFPFAPPDSRKP
jgi:hypothetical protein